MEAVVNEPIGIATVLAEITRRFEAAAPKNFSGGVENRHAELPCKHGDSAKGGLMTSAHSLVRPNNASGSSAPPTGNLLPSPSDPKYSSAVPVDLNVEAQNFQVPVLADDDATPLPSKRQSAEGCRYPDVKARESNGGNLAEPKGDSCGLKTFSSEGPEPEELDSFYDRLDTGGLELQAPTFDPDLYD